MKVFHISDVLSVTTGRLVSTRHIDGVYDILKFLTGDSVFTHQIPRVYRECEPWLRTQFPKLFPDDPTMIGLLEALDENLKGKETNEAAEPVIVRWVESVRLAYGMPENLPVYELGADMHTHVDPIEEARAMLGDDKVLVAEAL